MKKKIFSIIICFILMQGIGKSQNAEYILQNYHPSSPSAFQFLKYGEMPVSEYTGIPNIAVPVYEIKEDGVQIPINLTYHAVGIRVSQEASWVGLGWDMNFGSIVQEINHRDDYASTTIRLQPDWNESPVPSLYIQKYADNSTGLINYGWNNRDSVVSCKPYFSYRIYSAYPISVGTSGTTNFSAQTVAHAYLLPLNGNRDSQTVATDIIENPNYDSEPDIFTANFLGHSIKFIRNPLNNQILVLNKQGYAVNRTGDVYQILDPSGVEYDFELNTTVTSYTSTYNGFLAGGSPPLPSSRIWMLTKIITRNKRQILFNYSQSGTVNNYPSYSEKWDTTLNSLGSSWSASQVEGYYQLPIGNGAQTEKSISYSNENRLTLNSIIFPNGEVDFFISNRSDLLGGQKLDSVKVKSAGSVIKSAQFNYTYWNSSGVGGTQFQPDSASNYGNTPNLRLKLLSIQDNSGAIYSFTYNENLLPAKNSLAQDFWGFYNGQLNNKSLIPNPVRLNSGQLGGITGLSNNGNNNSANLTYATSGILMGIKFPTGGSTTFEYELNQFNNYWVPDFSSTSNVISSGNGLRIHAINYNDSITSSPKRTVYSYSIGKASIPVQLSRQFRANSIQSFPTSSTYGTMNSYSIFEMSGKGFFSSNSLSSGNYVGYDTVAKQNVDLSGVTIGKTVSVFYNTPDNVSTSAYNMSQLSISVPVVKQLVNWSPGSISNFENGKVQTVLIYDKQNTLLRKTQNTYTNNLSTIYYGARFLGYDQLFYNGGGMLPKTLTAYYPIYDFESLPNTSRTTDYTTTGDSIVNATVFSFDGYDQLSYKQTRSSDSGYVEEYYNHAYDYYQSTKDASLWLANIFSEVTDLITVRRKSNYGTYTNTYRYDKNYTTVNGRIVTSKVTIKPTPDLNAFPKIITYDQYDTQGNLQQYSSDGITNAILWDYNNDLIIGEIKSASLSQVAYTSFEADGSGNWVTNSITIDSISAAVTGRKSCILGTGTISKSGLISGNVYIVSYWSNNGPKMISGGSGSMTVGRTYKGWTYYEHLVTASYPTFTVSGSGSIDELRLYPQGAQMATYTHTPLIGMTSQCDSGNKILYYDYDLTGRLIDIKDQNGNIVKTFKYHYAGQ
ncbi:hypothetical protein SAMN05444410_11966 [Hydrobacter penzbergensis]|uniref:YD repeat-containing protein n=1 Tax=Hydrobacter penzbergensis TaxID=1235997 RepID=A0A8X8IIB2_9BACT|nr:hypothetical protein [Hydrobacter penzbergensis]SDX54994.1 hypothetical protein SAMN05444410_11966 [Hydrobacter penzbergensis]